LGQSPRRTTAAPRPHHQDTTKCTVPPHQGQETVICILRRWRQQEISAHTPRVVERRRRHLVIRCACAARGAKAPVNWAGPLGIRQAHEQFGWSEDRNGDTDYRFVGGSSDRYLPLVQELIAPRDDVILAAGTVRQLAAANAGDCECIHSRIRPNWCGLCRQRSLLWPEAADLAFQKVGGFLGYTGGDVAIIRTAAPGPLPPFQRSHTIN